MITVLVVDDHPVVRGGLVGWLDAQPDLAVVGEAGDGQEALARVAEVGGELDVVSAPGEGTRVTVRVPGA